MAKINSNYQKLQASYLFSEIAKRVRSFAGDHPDAKIIRLGIGDVVLPLPPPIVDALKAATDEMASRSGFKGYGPEQGYDFLLNAISAHYASQGAQVAPDEIFVSDGSKCDSGNIQEIFALDNVVAVTDPVYPVYVDTNVMAGRTDGADAQGRYGRLVYLPTTAENGFDPALPDKRADLIYLCSPNNPTGAVLSRASLTRWVEYAKQNESVILVRRRVRGVHPRARPGAQHLRDPGRARRRHRAAQPVEDRRLHRHPLRVHGHPQRAQGARRRAASWCRCTRCGTAATPPSSTASATRSRRRPRRCSCPRARRRSRPTSPTTWRTRASSAKAWRKLGYQVYGGVNAPYIWVKVPSGLTSWGFFDKLLSQGPRGRHPRLGLRQLRRRVLPAVGLRLPRKRRGSHRPHHQAGLASVVSSDEPSQVAAPPPVPSPRLRGEG